MQELPLNQEKRLVFRLLHLWRDARGDGLYPSLAAVHRRPFGEIFHWTFELKLDAPDADPRFRRVGALLARLHPVSFVGQPISTLPHNILLAHAVAPYRIVLARGLPMCVGDEFTDATGRLVLYRTIIMPVSDDGVHINALFGGANTNRPATEEQEVRGKP